MNGSSESSENLSKNYLKTFLQGAIMGIAEVIPGVSGSTLALIMGFYHDFIALLDSGVEFVKTLFKYIARKSDLGEVKKAFTGIDFKFAIPLFLGTLAIILTFANILEVALEEYPQYVYAIFFGLILTSIAVPLREVKKFTYKEGSIFVVSFILIFLLLGYKGVAPKEDPSELLLLFGGIVGISGMVLPGISGAFILLLLGIYEYVFSLVRALTKFDFSQEVLLHLFLFLAGLGIGLISFVKLLKFLLKEYRSSLMTFLAALMAASLRVLWPFMEHNETIEVHQRVKMLPWELANDEAILITIVLASTIALSAFIISYKKPK